MKSLVQPMFDGPVDVIGDVHGEIEALTNLLQRLGYRCDGSHPQGRRLIFVGDLVDRGPDSPAVLRLVMPMVAQGRAQCVMGNHELNLLLGRRKKGNSWYFAEEEPLDRHGRHMPQVKMDDALRSEFDAFIQTLPLALEREDLRVVHACWDDPSIEAARKASCARTLFEHHEHSIHEQLDREGISDPIDRDLARQNENPVKVLTSGLEERSTRQFHAGGKVRLTKRTKWWDSYRGEAFTVFGHYWRVDVVGEDGPEPLFDQNDPYSAHSDGRCMCIDYSVGGRWIERQRSSNHHPFKSSSLAALRWPELVLVCDRNAIRELTNSPANRAPILW